MQTNTFVFFLCLSSFANGHLFLDWETSNPAIDQELFDRVLDPEQCQKQISFITRNSSILLARFIDAGARIPRGVLTGNTIDWGNYHQCLAINQIVEDIDPIQGKYCLLRIPANQEFEWPSIGLKWADPDLLKLDKRTGKQIEDYHLKDVGFKALLGADVGGLRSAPGSIFSGSSFSLAMCLPQTCTTQEFITGLLFNVTAIGFEYTDQFCRLPNDKPWVPADYVAIAVFAFLGLLTALSTFYDIRHTIFLKRDPKKVNKIYSSFSLYTNTRRLLTFTSTPNSLDCVDGVRALAMAWVILGHSFSSQPDRYNPFDVFQWISSHRAIWILAGHVTVDTFFMLSGLLVVYTTAGKFTSMKLLKNLHLFYLNRLLRMFPLLAATVLLEASFFNRATDGPIWNAAIRNTNTCRKWWWTTLLHVQNYVNPEHVCIGATWYLAIDVQLHILCPIILVWVLSGRPKVAWGALTVSLVAVLAAATTYNFVKEFPSSMMAPGRGHEMMYYMIYYYMNTLPRSPPFVVGMVYGYLLHTWKGEQMQMPKMLNLFLWCCALSLLALVMYAVYPISQFDWNNQTLDSLYNSFLRPAWAMGVGWIIFACVNGYGGPINWFLSLGLWKLPARLSYGLYLLHFPLMVMVNSAVVAPIYFSVESILFKFLAFFALSFVVSFIATVFVDSPFSTLFKLLLGSGPRRAKKNENITENTKQSIVE